MRTPLPRTRRSRVLVPWALPLLLGAVACGPEIHAERPHGPASTTTQVALAPAPEFSPGQFPCTDCHEADLPFNPQRRALQTAHSEFELHHGGERMWCFDCHDQKSRDKLHTAGGELIDFADAQLLCAQCHQGQYADWLGGAHGRRTGKWAGDATALRCASCHSAHAPKFQPLEPMPGPQRPRTTR